MIVSTVSSTESNTYTEDWFDARRGRTVPVRIFLPDFEKNPAPCPVVLLSHGLGGSREGFGYLGEYWSQNGYVVLVMQHPGSDISIFRNRKPGEKPREIMLKSASATNAKDRYEDVRFVLDELELRNTISKQRGTKLSDKLDLNRIGLGGHSFGSQTTLAAIGRFPYKADPRIKAAIAMSPNRTKTGNQKQIHAPIRTPTLHFTGTKDDSPLEPDFDPKNRRVPFDSIQDADQYLVIFEDGNHMIFSGHRRPFGLSKLEEKYQPIIAEITLKFLDAYLRENSDAVDWLQKNGMKDIMKDSGTIEIKLNNCDNQGN